MDPLRLIILLIGLVIIAGIYLRYRQKGQSGDELPTEDARPFLDRLKTRLPKGRAEQENRIGPAISMEDVESLGEIKVHGSEVRADELTEGMHVGWDSMTPVAAKDECIIVFNILARPGEQFSAEQIRQAAADTGFEYGEMQIFHFRTEKMDRQAPAVCSFANVVEPGHFAALQEEDFSSPGISLFACLPGPLEAREAFKLTLDKAHGLASSLGGILCDETRSILSEQTVSHIKEKVEAFRFKQQMAAMQQRRH